MERVNSPGGLISSLPDRYSSSEIFKVVPVIKESIGEEVVGSQDLHRIWTRSQDNLSSLNDIAKEEGLLSLDVLLTGEGIKLPSIQSDLGSAAVLSSLNDAPIFAADSLQEYHQAHEARGLFAGFTLDFIKEDIDKYRPVTAYKVATKQLSTPNLDIRLHATGPVETTRLAFTQDSKKDTAAELALSLIELCGNDSWSALRLIHEASVLPERIDGSRLRHLAYHSEKIINTRQAGSDQGSIERKLADMIELTFPDNWRAKVDAREALQVVAGQRRLYSTGVAVRAGVNGVVFRDEFRENGGDFEPTGRRALNLVLTTDADAYGTFYIPVSTIVGVDTF